VQHAALVRVVNGPRHLHEQTRRLARPLQQARHGRRQVPAVNELHAEVLLAVVLADLVDGDDVGVVERGDGLGLPAEALALLGGGQLAREDHLEGDDAVERHLARLVHHPHPAAGDLFEQLVVAEAPHRWQPVLRPIHPVEFGEERRQPLRQLRVAVKEFLAVGRGSRLDRNQVVGNDPIQRAEGGRPVIEPGHSLTSLPAVGPNPVTGEQRDGRRGERRIEPLPRDTANDRLAVSFSLGEAGAVTGRPPFPPPLGGRVGLHAFGVALHFRDPAVGAPAHAHPTAPTTHQQRPGAAE
jgi:hypothetical protein